nr:hypothetical protein [Desulfonema ishimotonii]
MAVLTPGTQPLQALAGILARIVTGDSVPVAKTREFAEELKISSDTCTFDGLSRISALFPDIQASPLIILIDQFEEIYTYEVKKEKDNLKEYEEYIKNREAFIATLLHAASDKSGYVSVILTLRSDFLGETQAHPLLNQTIAAEGEIVPAMSEDELRAAIARPAENAGHPLDKAVVDMLVEQSRDRDGALPLLQFALTRIWENLPDREPAETLDEIGGVGGALAEEAQRLYDSLNKEEKAIARRAFLSMVTPGEGTKDTRRRAAIENMVTNGEDIAQVKRVLERFSYKSARLITLSGEEGTQAAEVTHEALLEHWREFREWLDENREDIRFHRRVEAATVRWNGQGRPDGSLWQSPDLDLLKEFHERAATEMAVIQTEFFKSCVNREKRSRKIKQFISVLLILLSIITVTSALKATNSNRLAQKALSDVKNERKRAQSFLVKNYWLNAARSIEEKNIVKGLHFFSKSGKGELEKTGIERCISKIHLRVNAILLKYTKSNKKKFDNKKPDILFRLWFFMAHLLRLLANYLKFFYHKR